MAAGEKIFCDDAEIAERSAAICALERLKQLADVVPEKFFQLNPIRTLELMSQENEFAYCPYTIDGYPNYSRPGYAPHLLAFGDVIGIQDDQPALRCWAVQAWRSPALSTQIHCCPVCAVRRLAFHTVRDLFPFRRPARASFGLAG